MLTIFDLVSTGLPSYYLQNTPVDTNSQLVRRSVGSKIKAAFSVCFKEPRWNDNGIDLSISQLESRAGSQARYVVGPSES